MALANRDEKNTLSKYVGENLFAQVITLIIALICANEFTATS